MNGDERRPAADADEGGQPSRSPSTADERGDRRGGGGRLSGEEEPDEPAPTDTTNAPAHAPDTGSSGVSTPPPVGGSGDGTDSLRARFFNADSGGWLYFREVLTSVLAVAAVGMLLFAVSGVWPPMVAVESGSMEPHMYKGDLIFITEPGRYMPADGSGETGVVTVDSGADIGYRTFGDYGSVVVYDNPTVGGSPIIHRAHFWVDAGENWYERANPDYVRADSCAELRYCPAPHAGFITKGDNNARYDQASDISGPVRAEWVTGVARVRVPLLGWIRLSIATALPGGGSPTPAYVGAEPSLASGWTPAREHATTHPAAAVVTPGVV